MINNQESAGEGSARDKEDHEVHKEYVFEEETCEVTSKLKIKFPFDEIIQEKMRRADLSNYSHLSDLISHPSKTDTCKHGNSWSTKDPKSMGWIYSKTELHTPTMYQKESAQSTTEKHRATATANTSMTARMTSYKLFQMENQKLAVLQEQLSLIHI